MQPIVRPSLSAPVPPESRDGRLIAIGDIHGCVKPLSAILDALQPARADTLVILGDFINRGPATRQVIDCLIQLGQQTELVVIQGNHEEELLASWHDATSFSRWLAMGGRETLESYGCDQIDRGTVDLLDALPADHRQFMESSLPWWECDNFLFTHAGYDPHLPLSSQTSVDLRWLALNEWPVQPHCSGKTAIVGHTANLSGRIVDYGFLKCIDTGCGLGGCLTALDCRSGATWQCGEQSEKVSWN